jgi:hypothetical protein
MTGIKREIVSMKKQLALATVLAAALAAGSVHAQSAGQATEAQQSSESIRMMQQALQNEGFEVQIDGIWGPNTEQALQRFQERQQQMGMSGQTAATPDPAAPVSGSTLGAPEATGSPGMQGSGTGTGATVDSPQTAQERGWDRAGGIDQGSDTNLGTGAGETGVGAAGAGAGGAGSGTGAGGAAGAGGAGAGGAGGAGGGAGGSQ